MSSLCSTMHFHLLDPKRQKKASTVSLPTIFLYGNSELSRLKNCRIFGFFVAETYQDRKTKQQYRTHQRIQNYCSFTLCQRFVRTASPLPTTTRCTHCFQVGDYAKISVSTTRRRCRPGLTRWRSLRDSL